MQSENGSERWGGETVESNRNTHYAIVSLSHFVLPFIYFIIHGDCLIQRWVVSLSLRYGMCCVLCVLYLLSLTLVRWHSHQHSHCLSFFHVSHIHTHRETERARRTVKKCGDRTRGAKTKNKEEQLNVFTIVLFSIGFVHVLSCIYFICHGENHAN